MKRPLSTLLKIMVNILQFIAVFVLTIILLNFPFAWIFNHIEIDPLLMGVFVLFISLVLFIIMKIILKVFNRSKH